MPTKKATTEKKPAAKKPAAKRAPAKKAATTRRKTTPAVVEPTPVVESPAVVESAFVPAIVESHDGAPAPVRGRPTTYTDGIAAVICSRIAEGETLRAICRDEDMPAWRTVYDWIEAHTEFSARIARARELGADAIAQQALEIADTPMEGVRVELGAKTSKEIREDMLGHRRLQVETRLKLLAKWFPKKYGDRVAVAGDADAPLQHQHSGTVQLTPAEAYARMLGKA